ncbi:hypothetical protein [Paenibacillus sp. MMS18-CY102]|uniref:hypothetical protein n=1 Tax=Paenibacillus sp. MMS18-CY102 TaxID=2682849 RepID=UPI0013652E20|nr:hypothetical protein [Paenibacillus sp. MMS18-CY102]MWC29499.1 hypothetical protein [Paenibacillus sp. MMS18-CY102]
MNRKWLASLVLLCVVLLLAACFQRNETKVDGQGEVAPGQGVNKGTEKLTEEGNTPLYDLKFDLEKNSLILSDLTANQEVKTEKLDANSFAKNIFRIDKGFAVEVFAADEPVKVSKGAGVEMINYPQNFTKITYRLYSEQLELRKEADLTSKLPVQLKDVNALKAVSADGNRFLWTSVTGLYQYDATAGQFSEVLNDANNTIVFVKATYAPDNKRVVYYGSQVGDEEDVLSYGLVDLASKQVTVHKEKQYLANEIAVSNRYASITDTMAPRSNTSSGKVLMLDMDTEDAFSVAVDGLESVMARVTGDGKALLAVKEEKGGSYRIRQYAIPSGKAVKEETFELDKQPSTIRRITETAQPTLYNFVVLDNDGQFSIHPFTCEE